MSPVFVNTVRASFYRFRPDLGGLRVRREILVWRTVLPQCGPRPLRSLEPGALSQSRSAARPRAPSRARRNTILL